MVQYILTPWRDRRELLKVRQQFYPAAAPSAPAAATTAPSTKARMAASTTRAPATAAAPPRPSASSTHAADTTAATSTSANDHSAAAAAAALAAQHHAVARVSMWMQRGNCPHMVESTALLTAAILSDGESSGSAGTYAVRAAYAAAFSRYVLASSSSFFVFLLFLVFDANTKQAFHTCYAVQARQKGGMSKSISAVCSLSSRLLPARLPPSQPKPTQPTLFGAMKHGVGLFCPLACPSFFPSGLYISTPLPSPGIWAPVVVGVILAFGYFIILPSEGGIVKSSARTPPFVSGTHPHPPFLP